MMAAMIHLRSQDLCPLPDFEDGDFFVRVTLKRFMLARNSFGKLFLLKDAP